MIGRESPHDHWADMGLDDEKPAPRFDPVTGAPMVTKRAKAFTADELEFMDFIGE